jgi:outer membrane receptor protein involved in Fe transport
VTKIPQSGYQSIRINPSAVEEVTIISGGFDAEYGDALSGIINIVTKEGGTKLSGKFNYLTDEIFPSDELNFGYNFYELSLGGPIPMAPRFRYFLSGELMLTDAYRQAKHMVVSPRMDYKAQGRFSYHLPNAKGKVTFSGFYSREQWVRWIGTTLKYFKNRPMDRRKNWFASATFNYMLTARTLMSLRLGATHFQRMYGTRDYEWEADPDNGWSWYKDYRFTAEHLIPSFLDGSVSVKDLLIDSLMQYHEEYTNRDVFALRGSPYGIEGLYYTYGDYRVWRFWYNNDYQGRFDVTHSIGKVHEIKTGIDFTQYDMRFYDNNLPWVTNPFWDAYHRKPYKIATYIQDRMDFEGLIARIGLRFDYFDPKTFTWANPNDFQDSTMLSAEKSYKISPRLGFSLPVTERMKLRFNYGHYFQLPALDNMYGVTDTSVIRVALTRGNTIIGNIEMALQKTVQYEVGIENQFTDDVALSFTTYFKDIYDLAQIREVLALPMSYFQYFNVDYGNVRGFEVQLQKRMANMWALGLTYTLQFARGTASNASEWYYDHYDFGVEPPVIDYWLDFDERHIVNANLDFDLPRDFFLIPLQNFTSSVVFNYHSGHPYTPENLKGERIGDENSARMPGYWNVDFGTSRRIHVGSVNVQFSALITNLFNTRQVIDVYTTTGDPEKHGDPEPGLGQFGPVTIASTRYSPQADYNHDGLITPEEYQQEYILARNDYYSDPLNFNGPLRIQLGVGIGF